nr:DUF4397 domain-containing protein [uncultured Chitinophaga sp.]
MSNKIQLLISVYTLALFLSACSRQPDAIAPEDAKVAFYNASQLMRKEVEAKNQYVPSKPAFILLNTAVPHTPDTLVHMSMKDHPFFALSTGGQQFYPMLNTSTTSVPWMSYMRVAPGSKTINFLHTDTTLAVTSSINLARGKEHTIFLADSMGRYTAITTDDAHTPFDKGFSLRLVHAAPDTGRLRLRVNGQWMEGDWKFGEASSFMDIAIPDSLQNQVVRVNLSPASDTAQVIYRMIVKCGRREMYTIIPNGYISGAPASEWIADFRCAIIRNK